LEGFSQSIKLRNQFKGIQLQVAELLRIVHAIRSSERCNMLVFGLGNDSPFWVEVNGNGRNVFLEDFKLWFDKVNSYTFLRIPRKTQAG